MECEFCKEEIAADKSYRSWHNDCFKCKECGKPLLDNFECRNGIFYCTQRCYKRNSSKSVFKTFETKEKYPFNLLFKFPTKDKNKPSWIPQSKTNISLELPKKYEARGGVVNLGPEFEYKMTTLLALRLLRYNAEEFWLASNVRNVGAFDDIILHIKFPKEDPITYMIQLKHQENPRNIDQQAFLASSGDFSLLKYTTDIQNLSQSTSNKIFFIIYTNRNVDDLSILEPCLDNTLHFLETHGQHSKCFTFNNKALDETGLNEEFHKTILLFANQAGVKDVDKEIWREVHAIFKSKHIDVGGIVKNLTVYITDWARGNLDGHYLLTREEVESKLFHLYYTQFQINFSEAQFSNLQGSDFTVWSEITSDKTVTVINNGDFVSDYMLGYIHSELKKFCDESVPTWLTVLKCNFSETYPELTYLLSKICPNKTQFTLVDVYQCLCVLKILPLVVVVNKPEELSSLLGVKQESFKIVVLCGCDVVVNSGFTCMKDLSYDHCNMLLSQTIFLQGRRAVLNDCINESLYELVKCCDIIKLLSGSFKIGEHLTPLPESFVDIKVTKTFLKTDVVKISSDCFVIDDCIPEDMCDTKPVHFLYTYDNCFLWKYSKGTTKNLADYTIEIEYGLKQGICNKDFFDKTILVSALPGMGKSVLMTYVAQSAPTNKWVIRIDLNDHQHYFKTDNCLSVTTSASQHLEYFKGADTSFLQTSIFNKFVDKKDIIVLLDGFDEVSITHKNAVTNIAKSLSIGGFQVWLTTRPVMQKHIEDELEVRAISIKPFTSDTQTVFLHKYFCANNPDLDTNYIQEFVVKLITAANKHLNYSGIDFTGIPLQINLLGSVFNDDCRKYVESSGTYSFNENFDLLYLYQNFVDKKLDLLFDKFGGAALDARSLFTEHHAQFALRVLFSPELLKGLDDKKALDSYYKTKENKMLLMQREGIIIIDENFVINFTHRTYAEYLAANWIAHNLTNTKSSNVARLLYRERFTDSYNFLFRIFDQIAVHNYPLHISVINGTALDVPCDRSEDSLGRNVLHLVGLYTPHFPLRNYFKQPILNSCDYNEKLFNIELGEKTLFKKDNLGYNPLDYALESRTLSFANKLCSHFVVEINVNVVLRLQYLEYCAYLKYVALFKVLLTYSIQRDLLLRYVANESLSDYCRFYLIYDSCILTILDDVVVNIFNNDDGNSALHIAVINNQVDVIANNVEGGINNVNNNGCTPLDLAIACGSYEAAQLLLAKGASASLNVDLNTKLRDTEVSHHWVLDRIACDILVKRFHEDCTINEQDRYGNTPLHAALQWDKLELASLLVLLGADSSLQNNFGETPLHIAAIKGFSDVLSGTVNINIANHNKETPLHLAVYHRKTDSVKVLLHNHADAHLKNTSGNTPLHLVETLEIAKLLLEVSDVNARNNLGETPLHTAVVQHDRVDIVKLLIAKGADLNAQNISGETPLHLAAVHKNYVQLLTESGADINIRNTSGAIPLHYTSMQDINRLCDNLDLTDFNGNTPLHYACAKGQVDVINALIKKGANPMCVNEEGRTPLHCAVKAGFIIPLISNLNICDLNGNTPLHLASLANVVGYLVENGADANICNKMGKTPLMLSLHDLDITKRLCECTNVNAHDCDGNTALHLAVQNGYIEVINVLHNAHINKTNKLGKTPLYYAPNCEVLNCLIHKGAVVNIQDINGNTPLHTATFHGRTDIVRHLISKGAQVDCRNKSLKTPLHFASAEGHVATLEELCDNTLVNVRDFNGNSLLHVGIWSLEMVACLIHKGAAIDERNNKGETALHYACSGKHLEVVLKLLKNNADPNTQDSFGNTPLHYTDDDTIVTVLIKHKALVNVKNLKGETPLHLSTSGNVAEALIINGAKVNKHSNIDNTPLHYAAINNHLSVLNVLLEHDADVNYVDLKLKSALSYAFDFRHYYIISALVKAGADVTDAFNKNHIGVFGYLLLKNIGFSLDKVSLHDVCSTSVKFDNINALLVDANINRVDHDGNTPLHVAILHDTLKFYCDVLLENGADVNITNKNNETCLHLAAYTFSAHFDAILDNTSNINAQNNLGETALHIASQCAETHNVCSLISKSCDVKAETLKGETALFYATEHNIWVLLDNGAYINHKNKDGNTPLHVAILRSKSNEFSTFIWAGADVNVKNNMGLTPLHLSVTLNNEYFVWLLLDNKADTNLGDNEGNTPLHISCEMGFYHCAAKLIESGANLNLQNNQGNSPVHSCLLISGYFNVIELLAESGANLNIVNNAGLLPLKLALKLNFVKSIATLKAHGAIENVEM